jgi:hypothetical protein
MPRETSLLQTTVDTPKLACRIDAFTPDQRQRYRVLREALGRATVETIELPDGYCFRYRGDEVFQMAAEWVTLERRCCPFFDFALAWEREGAPTLTISGGPGVKEFIADVLHP